MLWWLLGSLGLTGGGIGIAALLGGGPFMLMAAKWLWSWLSHATFLQVVCLVLGIALAIDHVALLTAHHGERAWHKQFDDEHKARNADRAAYAKAQADAHVQNIVQVAKIEQQQKRITDDVETRYRADLARLRAERVVVRPANAAPQRPAGGSSLPAPGPAPGGPDPKAVSLPPAELLRAEETELQLNALIDWVLGQSKADPNKP